MVWCGWCGVGGVVWVVWCGRCGVGGVEELGMQSLKKHLRTTLISATQLSGLD